MRSIGTALSFVTEICLLTFPAVFQKEFLSSSCDIYGMDGYLFRYQSLELECGTKTLQRELCLRKNLFKGSKTDKRSKTFLANSHFLAFFSHI